MRAPTVRSTLVTGIAALTLVMAGCGSDEPAEEATGGSSGMDGMDMSDVTSMNDPDATPASEVSGAAEGDFAVLDSAPPGSEGVAGSAWLAQDGGTTVTVELSGLEPGATYMAHLHAEACGTDEGGPHFQFEEGGSEVPPNEVHLGLEADDEGNATATTTNEAEVGDGAPSVVVHPTDLPDNRLACADF